MKSVLITAALSAVLMAGAAQAQTTTDEPRTTWSGWGAARYANSFEEACRRKTQAIQGMSMPQEARDYFIRTLGNECAGGEEIWLTPDDHLEQMWSGASSSGPAHIMENVTVATLPVRSAPNGRPYRPGAVAQTARALAWRYTASDGRTYELVLPFECFNFAWRYVENPGPPVEDCYTVRVRVDGRSRALLFALYGSYRPSVCFAMRRPGSSEWEPLPTHCPEGDCDFSAIQAVVGMRHTQSGGVLTPEPGIYEFRVSVPYGMSEAAILALCQELIDGTSTLGIGIVNEDYHDGVADVFYQHQVPAGYAHHVIHWRFGSYESEHRGH